MFKIAAAPLPHISLAFVGLMWVFPFLHYHHQYPLTSFYQEWWSAMLGTLAISLLVSRSFWQAPETPRIAQLPIALLGVVLLQWALGRAVYLDQILLYALYLLFAALLMLLGARLRDCFGLDRLTSALAVFLLIGAELSALLGVLQHFQWNTPLDAVVTMKMSPRLYGNLAQANHFANYIALGMISLGLLFQQGRLKARYVVLLALPLLFVMPLSGSRSTWLYLLLICGLAWWWARRDAAQRPLLRYSLLLLVGFGVMHQVVQLPFLAGASVGTDTVQQLFESASGSIRLFLWREAWLIFTQSPLLGAGFGQFAWQHFQLQPVLQPDNIAGLYNNAHNLIFQVAAEAGIAGLLALLAPLAVWFYGQRRAPLDTARWWGYAVLGVLAIHSLLEFPLWYAYFVAIAAIMLGALDETRYRLELRKVGRLSVAVIIMLGLLALLQLRSGYQHLEEQVFPLMRAAASAISRQTTLLDSEQPAVARAFERIRDVLIETRKVALLSPYAELFTTFLIRVNDEHLEEKLKLNTRVLRFVPIAPVAYRQALLLAQAGQQEQAATMMVQAIWSYPGEFAAVRGKLEKLAKKDPARFAALLEFAVQKERERRHAVHQ